MISSNSRKSSEETNKCNISCRWIKKPSLKYLDSIILNRLDLSYDHGIYWIAMTRGVSSCVIPIYVNAEHAWISLLRVTLTSSELQVLFEFVFASKQDINRLSFKTTEVDPACGWTWIVENKSSAWFLDLEGTYEEVLKRSSAKTRYAIRHDKKCLEERIGQVYIKAYTLKEITQEILEQYLLLKSQCYDIPNNENTIEKLFNNSKLDITDVYILCSGEGKTIAVQLTSEHGQLASLVNMAYDPVYKNISPGRLLYVEVINLLIEKKRKLLYLGSGNAWYKKLFGTLETNYWVGDAFRNEKSMKLVINNGSI